MLLVIDSKSANAKNEVVQGIYLNYKGAEYESTFYPCNSSEVIHIKSTAAFDELQILYNKLQHTKYGEILVKLEMDSVKVNKQKYPNSHYTIIATVLKVLESSTNIINIEICRSK